MPEFNWDTKVYTIDVESTGDRAWGSDQPFGVGVCDDDGQTWYCEWPVDPKTRAVTPEMSSWRLLNKLCSDSKRTCIMHNSAFDYKMLAKMDISIKSRVEDTLFMARIWNNVSQDNGLKSLAYRLCGIGHEDVDELQAATIAARKVAKAWGWKIADNAYCDYWLPRLVYPAGTKEHTLCEVYCKQDVYRTMAVWHVFNHLFKKEEGQHWRKTYEFELELFHVVMKMERRGVHIDREACIYEREVSLQRMEESYAAMKELVGQDFSPNSPKQLREILYDKFGLESLDETASGDPSTRLTAIRPHSNHPFVNHLMTYRSAHKSIGTFFDNYLDKMRPDSISKGHWCLRPNINQIQTKTHRFSMKDPNLQQVANANTTTLGGRMVMARRPFGPRPGYVWFNADYAQQELRIFADLADIKVLKEAIKAGLDPNTENANFAWGGFNNPAAVYAAKLSLELKDPVPSKKEVQAVWDEFNWDPDLERERGGIDSRRASEIARKWLDRYDWKIVQAEATLGKKNTRSRCKVVTFDIMYGGGPDSLMGLLFCTKQEARGFLNTMHSRYPEIRRYSNYLQSELSKKGYVVNPYGRRLTVEEGRAYTCVNYVIQSTAAGMMKEAILKSDRYIAESGLDAHVVLTVHDELIYEVKKEHTYAWFVAGLRRCMEESESSLTVPVVAEFNACPVQWDKKIPIDASKFDDNFLMWDYVEAQLNKGNTGGND